MKVSGRQIWIVMLCIYIVGIAYLCFMRPDDIPEMRPDLLGIPIDKIMHFIMFFPYSILAYAAFRPSEKKRALHFAVLAVIVITGAGIAIGTEQIQGLIEYRGNEIKDFYADLAGISCSTLMISAYIFTIRLEK